MLLLLGEFQRPVGRSPQFNVNQYHWNFLKKKPFGNPPLVLLLSEIWDFEIWNFTIVFYLGIGPPEAKILRIMASKRWFSLGKRSKSVRKPQNFSRLRRAGSVEQYNITIYYYTLCSVISAAGEKFWPKCPLFGTPPPLVSPPFETRGGSKNLQW